MELFDVVDESGNPTGEIDIDKITVQAEELESVEWFDLEEVYRECLAHNQKFCVPVKGLEIAMESLRSRD